MAAWPRRIGVSDLLAPGHDGDAGVRLVVRSGPVGDCAAAELEERIKDPLREELAKVMAGISFAHVFCVTGGDAEPFDTAVCVYDGGGGGCSSRDGIAERLARVDFHAVWGHYVISYRIEPSKA